MFENLKERIAWHWNMNRHTMVVFGIISAVSAAIGFLGHGGDINHIAFAGRHRS
jgi:hypothetical protein